MVYHLIALIIIFFFLFLAYSRRISLYSPLVINCLCWLVVFSCGLSFYNRFYPLSANIYMVWIIWFLVTSLIFYFFSPPAERFTVVERQIRFLPFNYIWLVLILIVWLSYRIWVIGSTGPSLFFLNLRLASNGIDDYGSIGLAANFYPLIFALFIFENFYSSSENRYHRFVLWMWMFVYAVATMGKFAIITPIFVWIVINGLQGNIRLKNVIAILLFAIILMLFIHIVRAGEESTFDIIEMLAIYIYSPIVALGYFNVDQLAPFGAYVFRLYYAIGNSFGVTPAPVDVIMPYVSVPWDTNVYTVFFPFYHDFGFLGIFFFSIIYGLLFSLIFLCAAIYSDLYFLLYSSLVMHIFSQFIIESLFTIASLNLQTVLCILCVYSISRKKEYGLS